ncbi:hypothetical protein AAFF_G00103600 [Aldrovandia affinis]|uniref:MHD domain-containing protein n=1 Tax=Aldrovandia affinis TaxID=143900 RepID=A0AAD7RUF8_9TELE|nr:hypothetical protein AAFF_G00103600 [Aldrovandia affinis]
MMEGLKKRTRKAFGIRKKEKDTDSTGSPDKDGAKKANGAPNGFYGEIDWDRYNSPEVDEEGESEGEEDHRKKFKIKIKPLTKDGGSFMAPSVDELKASIGNIALSPSPLRMSPKRSPGEIERNPSCEKIARPRRSVRTLAPGPVPAAAPSPPEERLDATALFGPPFETAFDAELSGDAVAISEPEVWGAPKPGSRPDSPLTRPCPTGTPPPLPPKNIPVTPPTAAQWTRPFPTRAQATRLPVASPPPRATAPPLPASPPPELPPSGLKESPESPDSPLALDPLLTRTIPPPLILTKEDRRSPEASASGQAESTASPKELTPGPRAMPPPPPTYRAVVSSPGPCSAPGSSSGSSSPARPATPLTSSSPTPPPPPPRPSSRPKLPPGKPSVGDLARPFSPPINSSSPPPFAPLARAESTSSISSATSLSAATTPTIAKDLSVSVSENDHPSLVWFDRGKFYLTFEGCSRGPSPLTMGAQDSLPVAAAFTETVNAYFKGADPSKCVVKITGDMVLSFPAGITRHFANNPSPAILTFSITNYSRLEHVLPNPQLLCCDTTQPNPNSKEFWVNMPNLMTHLKKVSDQKPQATYYNVDMLKYQVSAVGIQATPLSLAVHWKCEPISTDLRIDYKYNGAAMTTATALNNVQFLVPVDGGVTKLQAVLPPAAWNAEQQRILWKIPDISLKSENGGIGSLLGRFTLTGGPSNPAPLAVQFTSEGSTLSGCGIELVGAGYRFSLIKKRFAAGKYLAEN